MEQHPVPQHIASFEFKLFGNLTIRQFVTLAIPMSLAALIFFSPGPDIIRFPLSIFFGGLGLFAALVPIQGRPFDKWVVAFTKAILSPTQRVWIKEAKMPQFLSIVINEPKTSNAPPEPITFQDRQRLSQYLRSLPKSTVSPLDVRERRAIEKLGFAPQTTPPSPTQLGKLPPPILWTTAGPKTKQAFGEPTAPVNLPSGEEQFQGIMSQALPQITPLAKPATAVRISPHAKPYALPGLEERLAEKQITAPPTLQLASNTNFSIENVIPIPGKRVRLLHGLTKSRARKLHFAPPKNFNLANLPVRGEARFEVSEELKKRFQLDEPALQPIPQIQETPAPAPKIEIKPQSVVSSTHQTPRPTKQNHFILRPQTAHFTAQDVTLKQEESEAADSKITIQGQKVDGTKSASILDRARIIPLTNTPNVLSGLVSDAAGIPLEGAIITLRDAAGIPVRALKTNKLGQFLSATPLTSGVYTLEIEHINASFEPIAINLTGTIMAPLEIKAKG